MLPMPITSYQVWKEAQMSEGIIILTVSNYFFIHLHNDRDLHMYKYHAHYIFHLTKLLCIRHHLYGYKCQNRALRPL